LAPEEFQMSIAGNAVGWGIASSEAFVTRMQDIEKLVYRTAERKTQRSFREGGRRRKHLERDVQVFVSTPRAASLAVSIRIGHLSQLTLEGISLPSTVIDDLFECLQLFNS